MRPKSLKEQAERKFMSFEEWKMYDKIQKKTAPSEVVNTNNSYQGRATELHEVLLKTKDEKNTTTRDS